MLVKNNYVIRAHPSGHRSLTREGKITYIPDLNRYDRSKHRFTRKIQQNLHDSKEIKKIWDVPAASFWTLTIAPRYYPKVGAKIGLGVMFRAFMNRLKNTYPDDCRGMSYFAVAEMGSTYFRWHIHLCTNRYVKIENMYKMWPYGKIHVEAIYPTLNKIGEVVPVLKRVVGYVGKYITKTYGKYHEQKQVCKAESKYHENSKENLEQFDPKQGYERELQGRQTFTSRDWEPYHATNFACRLWVGHNESEEISDNRQIVHLKQLVHEFTQEELDALVDEGCREASRVVKLNWKNAKITVPLVDQFTAVCVTKFRELNDWDEAVDISKEILTKANILTGFNKLAFAGVFKKLDPLVLEEKLRQERERQLNRYWTKEVMQWFPEDCDAYGRAEPPCLEETPLEIMTLNWNDIRKNVNGALTEEYLQNEI